MADSKISALTELSTADLDAAADFLVIVDTGAGATKKITPVSAIGTLQKNAQNAGYTCVIGDAAKFIYMQTAGTFTIPANASVAFPVGTVLTFFNATTACTIPITSDTMTLAGTALTGTRTLAANGLATALKLTSTTWVINGGGLT